MIKALMKEFQSIEGVVLDNIAHKKAREEGLIEKNQNLTSLIKALNSDRSAFLAYGQQALSEYAEIKADKLIIVDVGTGFLDAPESKEWVSTYRSISFMARPRFCFKRFDRTRDVSLSYEDYILTQFSPTRRSIYNSSSLIMNVSALPKPEVLYRFSLAVVSLLPQTLGSKLLNEIANKTIS